MCWVGCSSFVLRGGLPWKGVYLMPEEFVRSQELATSHVDALVGQRWRTLAVVPNRIVLSVRGVKAELFSL